jgi:hypothetical protein
MNPFALWLKIGVIFLAILFAKIDLVPTGAVSSEQASNPAACVAPEYRQFDFWAGDWDAFDIDSPTVKVARNRVDLILDGCVLREDYKGTNGTEGRSFSIYDASRGVWHQSWVTNRGQLLAIEGKFQNGEMILSGVEHTTAGETIVRGTWKPVAAGVREIAVTSTDGGKTWKPWFDLMFRPHKQ